MIKSFYHYSEQYVYTDPLFLTSVEANNFIPVWVATNRYASSFYEEIRGQGMYSKPDIRNKQRFFIKPNTIKNIKRALHSSNTPYKITMYGKDYFFAKGLLLDSEGRVLMVATLKKEHYDHKADVNLSINESLDDFLNRVVVFYSSSFLSDPNLAAFNRRLQKEMLTPCYEKGIEVRILPSSEIEANTFARLFEIKKTKSLAGLESYMKTVLPTILYTEEEDSFVEELGDSQELLTIEEEALLYDSDAHTSESSEMLNESIEVGSASLQDTLNTWSNLLFTGNAIGQAVSVRDYSTTSTVVRMEPLQNNYMETLSELTQNALVQTPSIVLIDDTE